VTALLAVRYGTVELRRAEAFHDHETSGEPDGPCPMDFFLWVLRSEGETILVDTGFDPAVARRRERTCLLDPVDALARLGTGVQAIERIVVTHLHYDHIGNLARFPDAQLLIPARELEFWLSPAAGDPAHSHPVERSELEHVAAARAAGRVRELEDGDAVAPGVRVLALPGHSPGQVGLELDAEHGPVILASDAVHFYEELAEDRPFAVFHDLHAMRASHALLREREAGGALVVPGHDPAVMERFPRLAGAAGEFAVRVA
jgi:glyoxylase-like metal-dependent hydrolase (beta-lactamase superfamily II)